MKINSIAHSKKIYNALHKFYKAKLEQLSKRAGSPEKLSKQLGVSKTVVRNTLARNSFDGMRLLLERARGLE